MRRILDLKIHNIMFFTHHLSHGGAEKTVCMLSEYINRNISGYRSYICVVYDDPEVRKNLSNVLVLKNKSKRDDSRFHKGVNVCRQIAEVRRLKKKYDIEVCISFLPGADIINVLSDTGSRKIVSVRSQESRWVHSIWKKIYVKTSYRLCDHIAAVSETVRQDIIDYFRVPEKKVTAIYNAVPAPKLTGRVSEDVVDFIGSCHIIINVGSLTPAKGQDHLIRAFGECIRSGHDDWKLIILGEGPRRKGLEELIRRLGLQDRVMLPGNKTNPADYLKRSDIYVMSSNVEGMPNALLEALSCGLPCISTECVSREILAPDTDFNIPATKVDEAEYGILIPLCDPEHGVGDESRVTDVNISPGELIMKDAILRFMDDPDLRHKYSQKAVQCTAAYTEEAIVSDWLRIIENR
jgi:N-acetylgalactosamine-N,N'-diacetylbacillosaminyl-diphospho-undecaprenol 4-alpha-N-acetylgalactosaminyltransferase